MTASTSRYPHQINTGVLFYLFSPFLKKLNTTPPHPFDQLLLQVRITRKRKMKSEGFCFGSVLIIFFLVTTMRSISFGCAYLLYVGPLYSLGIGLQSSVQHNQKNSQHRSGPYSKADGVY